MGWSEQGLNRGLTVMMESWRKGVLRVWEDVGV